MTHGLLKIRASHVTLVYAWGCETPHTKKFARATVFEVERSGRGVIAEQEPTPVAAFTSRSFAAAIGLERACFFSIAQKVFAVEGTFVREIVVVGDLTPLPRTPPGFGLFAVRDEVWPFVPLAPLFGLLPEPPRLAVLVSQRERRAAFGVGELLGFTPFDRSTLRLPATQSADAMSAGAEQDFGLGILEEGEHRALLLDVPALFRALRGQLVVP